MSKKDINPDSGQIQHRETRHLVIYGYTRRELAVIMQRFESQLPDYVKISIDSDNLVTTVTLTGVHTGVELLRFKMNKFHQDLHDLFPEEVVSTQGRSVSQELGELLAERELTVSCAESCTGGNLAHRITQNPGSSAYFLGSVVSYSNEVKTDVLNVARREIDSHGAVSKPVAEAMARGVATLMRTDCAISTTGIAGPDGGTKFKPVGTVWFAAKYKDQLVSECQHFRGDRNQVIESATNHAMVMLINLLRHTYVEQEDFLDD